MVATHSTNANPASLTSPANDPLVRSSTSLATTPDKAETRANAVADDILMMIDEIKMEQV